MTLIKSASNIYSDPPLKTVSTFSTTAENEANILLRYATLCWRKCQRFFYVFTMFGMCASCMLKSTYHCVQIPKQWESSPGTNGSGADFDLHPQCDFQSYTHDSLHYTTLKHLAGKKSKPTRQTTLTRDPMGGPKPPCGFS